MLIKKNLIIVSAPLATIQSVSMVYFAWHQRKKYLQHLAGVMDIMRRVNENLLSSPWGVGLIERALSPGQSRKGEQIGNTRVSILMIPSIWRMLFFISEAICDLG